ncbi:MAG: arginine--tRNA ligase [Streptosporangiales bacterium]|nr:arginine--tRNA ligase [Streptosporangiales bacterium]
MTDLVAILRDRLDAAFAAVAGERVDAAVRRSDRADFQADGALALAKPLRRNPREIAADVVAKADLDDLCERVEIAGPGFINLTVAADALSRLTAEVAGDARLGVPPAGSPETVVLDYSQPNIAKEMHVGHLRSTIIGDAEARTLEWLGHRVVRQNHVGDWGTNFGMLIEHLVDLGEGAGAHELSVGDLDGFYKAARAKFEASEQFKERSRRRVVLLQGGDEETLRLWHVLVDESTRYFQYVYDKLDVTMTPDDLAGESMYNPDLPDVVAELDRVGLLQDSDGARCVFPQGMVNREGEPMPLIVVKRDGGWGYDTTDLAAIRHRVRDLGATRILYVIDWGQRFHFDLVFQAAREAGWLAPPVRAEFVGFGVVLGTDGKRLRTRAGDSIKLADLLDEAVARAAAAVAEKNPSLDDETKQRVARAVGIGALKYADLSNDRVKDYVFDWDRMLSFDGNTAPYLQYAHARIRSIFRRGGYDGDQLDRLGTAPIRISEPAEKQLAIQLLGLAGVVERSADEVAFHRLCGYLYGVATGFTRFYEQCPVLKAGDEETRVSRLRLCDLTARVLERGLGLLGIHAPDRM